MKFSDRSENVMEDVDHKLVRVLRRALSYKIMDFTVVDGFRSIEDQQEAFRQGRTKIDGINKIGKHNIMPSQAVDVAPYPINYSDHSRFYYLAGIIMAAAKEEGVNIRFGGDWDKDGQVLDETFRDLPHFEII